MRALPWTRPAVLDFTKEVGKHILPTDKDTAQRLEEWVENAEAGTSKELERSRFEATVKDDIEGPDPLIASGYVSEDEYFDIESGDQVSKRPEQAATESHNLASQRSDASWASSVPRGNFKDVNSNQSLPGSDKSEQLSSFSSSQDTAEPVFGGVMSISDPFRSRGRSLSPTNRHGHRQRSNDSLLYDSLAPEEPSSAKLCWVKSELDLIASDFETTLMPLCQDYVESPPEHAEKRADDYLKLRNSVAERILLRLDELETDAFKSLQDQRNGLLVRVQHILQAMEESRWAVTRRHPPSADIFVGGVDIDDMRRDRHSSTLESNFDLTSNDERHDQQVELLLPNEAAEEVLASPVPLSKKGKKNKKASRAPQEDLLESKGDHLESDQGVPVTHASHLELSESKDEGNDGRIEESGVIQGAEVMATPKAEDGEWEIPKKSKKSKKSKRKAPAEEEPQEELLNAAQLHPEGPREISVQGLGEADGVADDKFNSELKVEPAPEPSKAEAEDDGWAFTTKKSKKDKKKKKQQPASQESLFQDREDDPNDHQDITLAKVDFPSASSSPTDEGNTETRQKDMSEMDRMTGAIGQEAVEDYTKQKTDGAVSKPNTDEERDAGVGLLIESTAFMAASGVDDEWALPPSRKKGKKGKKRRADPESISLNLGEQGEALSSGTAENERQKQVEQDQERGDEISTQPPLQKVVYPCEFEGYGLCNQTFDIGDEEAWIQHVLTFHLLKQIPQKIICWFCDHRTFVAQTDEYADLEANFRDRMYHIARHISGDVRVDYRIRIRPDFFFLDHLERHQLIPPESIAEAKSYSEMPPTSMFDDEVPSISRRPRRQSAERASRQSRRRRESSSDSPVRSENEEAEKETHSTIHHEPPSMENQTVRNDERPAPPGTWWRKLVGGDHIQKDSAEGAGHDPTSQVY